MKHLPATVAAILMAVLLFGCVAGTPQLSPLQLRKQTTRVIQSSYEDVFRATMTVLQDHNFVIKNTDMSSGLISAIVEREKRDGWIVLDILFGNRPANEHKKIEVTATVNTLNELSQEVRLVIQETTYSSEGDKLGITHGSDPGVYQKLLSDISLEVKRREAKAQ